MLVLGQMLLYELARCADDEGEVRLPEDVGEEMPTVEAEQEVRVG